MRLHKEFDDAFAVSRQIGPINELVRADIAAMLLLVCSYRVIIWE